MWIKRLCLGDPRRYRVHHAEGYVERLEIRRPTLTATNTYNYYRRDHLGNNCAVWDATNDTTLQKTVYYASGLPLSVSSGQSTQPYKYNGKEFIEMHGLDVTDLGFRSVHNARGRFDNMDPLCELAYHSSPYAISANNPVNNVDVLGLSPMKFESVLSYWEQQKLNRTVVDNYGIVIFHDDKDNNVYSVNSDGSLDQIGTEIKNEDYEIGTRATYNDLNGRKCQMLNVKRSIAAYASDSWDYNVAKYLKAMDLDKVEAKNLEIMRPIIMGTILFNPLFGIPNDLKTIFTGSDIYENKADVIDYILSCVDLATFGATKIPLKLSEKVLKNLKLTNNITTSGSVGRTISAEYENKK